VVDTGLDVVVGAGLEVVGTGLDVVVGTGLDVVGTGSTSWSCCRTAAGRRRRRRVVRVVVVLVSPWRSRRRLPDDGRRRGGGAAVGARTGAEAAAPEPASHSSPASGSQMPSPQRLSDAMNGFEMPDFLALNVPASVGIAPSSCRSRSRLR
jgi:hypothetical protein